MVILISVWKSLISPFAVQYYYLAGGSILLLGVIEGVLEILTMFPPLLGLFILRRYGLRYAILLSILLDLFGLGFFLLGSPVPVLVSIAVWSFSRMRAPVIKSVIAYASKKKGQAFGLLETITGIVSAVCPTLASFMLASFGTFMGLKILTVIALFLSFASLLDTVFGLNDSSYSMRSSEGFIQNLRVIIQETGNFKTSLLAFVLLEGIEGLGYLYPVIAVDYGCEPWLWGLVISASVLASTPAPVLAGRLLDKAGEKAILIRAFMLCLALLFACSFALPNYFWAFYIAIVFCGTALHTLANAYIAYAYRTGEHGEVYAVLNSLGAVAASLVALLAGSIYTIHRVSVFLLGILMLILAIVMVPSHKRSIAT